jgi:hypothetical protein
LIGPGRLLGIDEDEVFIGGTEVSRHPKLGGAGTVVGSLSGSKFFLGPDDVYSTSPGNNGSVQRLSLSTGETSVLVPSESNPTEPVEVGGFVFWGTTTGLIRRVAKSGGSPATLLTGQGAPLNLRTDGNVVYFNDVGGGTLSRMNPDGTGLYSRSVPAVGQFTVFPEGAPQAAVFVESTDFDFPTAVRAYSTTLFNEFSIALYADDFDITSIAYDGLLLVGGPAGLWRSNFELIVEGGPIVAIFADDERVYFEREGATYRVAK